MNGFFALKTLKTSAIASTRALPTDRELPADAQVQLRERRAAAAVHRLARAHLLERRDARVVQPGVAVRVRRDVVHVAVGVGIPPFECVHRQRRAVEEDRRHAKAPRRFDDGADRDAMARVGARRRAVLHGRERRRDILDQVLDDLVVGAADVARRLRQGVRRRSDRGGPTGGAAQPRSARRSGSRPC